MIHISQGFLTSTFVKQLVWNWSAWGLDKPLIENSDDDQREFIEGGAYDLRVGEICKPFYPPTVQAFIGIHDRATWPTKPLDLHTETDPDDPEMITRRYYRLPRRHPIDGTPMHLIVTVESVNLPDSMFALIFPRTTTFRNSALLLVSDVHPGYCGPLTFGIVNFGQKDLPIDRLAHIAKIRFVSLGEAEPDIYRGIYQGGKVSTEGQVERGF
jgi:deoxycytidine triphosphate deaminase